MISLTSIREPGIIMGAALAAVTFGLALPGSPWDAVALLVLIPLAVAAPTSALIAIVTITVLLHWDLQSAYQIFATPARRGVLFIDALFATALLRTAWQVARKRIDFDRPMIVASILMTVIVAETAWGLAHGAALSETGTETRRLGLGVGSFLLAWPLLGNPDSRRTLTRWLIVLGIALGLWGLWQWLFQIPYSFAGDFGIRGGWSSGQLQGGLYAYPVAVIAAWSALISGAARSRAATAALGFVVMVNGICVFLTFERTVIASTVVGCVFVAVVAGARARVRVYRWGSTMAVLLLAGAVLGEAQARTAFERMAMLGDVESDNSFSHRVIEGHVLLGEIAAHPIFGSGLGVTVSWGFENKFAESTTPFADLGYHWLAWKLGLVTAVLIVLLILRAVFRRPTGADDLVWGSLRTGARGALLALLLINVMFGVVNTLGITSLLGLLVAICYSRPNQEESRTFRHDELVGRSGRT